MTEHWAILDRADSVRHAIQAWHRAGMITDATRDALTGSLTPAPPVPGLVWRVLGFILGSFLIHAVASFFGLILAGVLYRVSSESVFGGLSLLYGAALAVLAGLLRAMPRFRRCGVNLAAAIWAFGYLVTGFAILVDFQAPALTLGLFSLVLLAAGAWVWGYATLADGAAIAFFIIMTYFPGTNFTWIAAGLLAAPLALAISGKSGVPPSHRRSLQTIAAIALLAAGTALNPYILDHGLLNDLWNRDAGLDLFYSWSSPPLWMTGAVISFLYAAAILIWGFLTRRTLLLDLGLIFTAASLATLRFYVHVAPLWIVLSAGGAGLALFAWLAERFLDKRPGQEWCGFTARPLFDDEQRQQALQTAAVAATFARPARPPEPAGSGDFTGKGGNFDGGGASDGF